MTKTFIASQIKLNLVDLLQQASDPSSGGGVAAAIGSFYLRSGTGQAWLKTAAANTGWTKLVQSFNWYSVKDYGAIGNGVADDTAAIQAAIDDCATNGGGRVFFPYGTYAVTQLTINNQDNVQLFGDGGSSVLKWVWNAATAAGSMLTITGGSQYTKIEGIRFDGSGLTNPHAGRLNHLLALVGGVDDCKILRCMFTAMVANSGDGVNVIGTAGNLVSKWWICDNVFDGCSRFGIGHAQGTEYGFVNGNYLTACDTEIGFVSTADLNATNILILGNEIVHTSATRHALRVEGAATELYTKLTIAENIVLDGFATMTLAQYVVFNNNIITSGAFASGDALLRIFGGTLDIIVTDNLIDRADGSDLGPVVGLERSGGASPERTLIRSNVLIQEKTGGNFFTEVDCQNWVFGANMLQATDADASTAYAIDCQHPNIDLSGSIIGTSNVVLASAGSFAAFCRLLASGADITQAQVVANGGEACDFIVRLEASGGGVFSSAPMISDNSIEAATGAFDKSGTTIGVRIGGNVGAADTQAIFANSGSPEGAQAAGIGSLYMRDDGDAGSATYFKETGSGTNTGWIALGGTMLTFGTGDTTGVATAVFLAPGWIATAIAAEIQLAMTRPATVRNLRVQVATAGVDAATDTYVVRKNGADTALTCALGNTATGAASDLVNSFTAVAGDLLSVQQTKSAGVTSGHNNVTATVELT